MTRTNAGLVIVAAVFIGAWVGGCQEEQTPDVRMNRLISAENIQLKEQIEALKKQIDRCEEEKHKAEKGLEEQAGKMMEITIDMQGELNAEIERLKAEVAGLKGESVAGLQTDSTPSTGSTSSPQASSPQADENEPPPPAPPVE